MSLKTEIHGKVSDLDATWIAPENSKPSDNQTEASVKDFQIILNLRYLLYGERMKKIFQYICFLQKIYRLNFNFKWYLVSQSVHIVSLGSCGRDTWRALDILQ